MTTSAVSGLSWLQVEAGTRNQTYLEEALWRLQFSPPADATLLAQAELLCSKPVPIIREYVPDATLLLALAELEGLEIPDIEQCARIRTHESRILYDIFGYEVTGMRKAILSACANLLVGEHQSVGYVKEFFRALA